MDDRRNEVADRRRQFRQFNAQVHQALFDATHGSFLLFLTQIV